MRPTPASVLALLLLCPNAFAMDRPIVFDGPAGARLSGTLLLPSGASVDHPVPAMVLVPGSGPTDRNGNQPPLLWTGLLKQLAEALAENGIASLRFDKRGVGRSSPAPRDFDTLTEFVAWENFVGDVVAACAAVRAQPEVDRSRTGLIGHSEGGLLVMHAAVALQDKGERPAALVLLATAGRPIDAVIRAQLAAACARLHVSDAGAARLLARNDAIAAEVREHGRVPADVPPDLAPLYPRYIGRFYQGQLRTPPADVAARLVMPVLVMQGDKDLLVSPVDDAPLLTSALKKRPGKQRSDLVLIAGASHNLKKVENEGEHAFFGPVESEARAALVGWLKDVLRDGQGATRRAGPAAPTGAPAPR
jgi:pimeloyl-ACP methyl ester carboxylesterase